MRVDGDYWGAGYAHLRGLFPAEIVQALLTLVRDRIDRISGPLEHQATETFVTPRPALQIGCEQFRPIDAFLWGVTPAISQIVGEELVPTFSVFRAYQQGDVLHVHRDRLPCEVSLSLTLAYSDDKPWPLDFATTPSDELERPIAPSFLDQSYTSIEMQPGDGVLYQGVVYRHGRLNPNPNAWSAHAFMHWVDANGPHRDQAFDKRKVSRKVDFALKSAQAMPSS